MNSHSSVVAVHNNKEGIAFEKGYGEYLYTDKVMADLKLLGFIEMTEYLKLRDEGKYTDDELVKVYWTSNNPRLRLKDGSTIWGAECWWTPEVDRPLEELQAEVDLFKQLYISLLEKDNG